MKVVNIKWDTDGDLKALKNLPTEVDITDEFAQSDYVEDGEFDEEQFLDNVSDWLSDTYGYCHKGFGILREIQDLNRVLTNFGVIYLEPLNGYREETDQIKIYDSDVKYIDCFSLEGLEVCADEAGVTVEEEYALRIKNFESEEDIACLIDCISENIVNWSCLKEELKGRYYNRIGNILTVQLVDPIE